MPWPICFSSLQSHLLELHPLICIELRNDLYFDNSCKIREVFHILIQQRKHTLVIPSIFDHATVEINQEPQEHMHNWSNEWVLVDSLR